MKSGRSFKSSKSGKRLIRKKKKKKKEKEPVPFPEDNFDSAVK